MNLFRFPTFLAAALGGAALTFASIAIADTGACIPDPAALMKIPRGPDAPLPDALAARLDAVVRAVLPLAAAPGIIAGVQTPEGRWSAAYGMADPAVGTAMQTGLHTRIGSLTKTFTATLLMKLADNSALSLDDPISAYVEDIPNGEHISLRMLANMTSGLPNYTLTEAFWTDFASDSGRVYAPEDLLSYIATEPPLFEPGTQFDYSNTNTVLLGMVIEQVSGQPIGDTLRAEIIEPLGLGATVWPGRSARMPEPLAHGFTLQGENVSPDAPLDATFWNPSWGWTAGEMISTLDDLMIYGQALASGQGLLREPAQAARLSSIPEHGGYGIGLVCAGGWIGHTGALPGYNTTLYHDANSATTVVVQANSDIPASDCGDMDVLPDNPEGVVCALPATRVFTALSAALGNEFVQSSAD
ncbi:serine hydrolase domain-containing protein [Pseudooceanicola algae]|uniref:D-alanyl-D-alanine carboxypeptidase n=1 Tax=Pseudooceanicola algae TaxID=1537215 RepID=A0A418SLH3_9RHOB|nr:serine hydrolase domain-containing protein [Pseudooceanicola algae]QPM90603.1 D-alanyl-D-alanine carboxypeptidase [Pseudooceanicola algae]